MEKKLTLQRQGTIVHLDIVRWAIINISKELLTDERIWCSVSNKDLTQET